MCRPVDVVPAATTHTCLSGPLRSFPPSVVPWLRKTPDTDGGIPRLDALPELEWCHADHPSSATSPMRSTTATTPATNRARDRPGCVVCSTLTITIQTSYRPKRFPANGPRSSNHSTGHSSGRRQHGPGTEVTLRGWPTSADRRCGLLSRSHQTAFGVRNRSRSEPANRCANTVTAGQGLEPRLPDPESGVLPLDDPAKGWRRIPSASRLPA
jgi:hypothetical protein